jgi:hypothetical protein
MPIILVQHREIYCRFTDLFYPDLSPWTLNQEYSCYVNVAKKEEKHLLFGAGGSRLFAVKGMGASY